MRRWRQVAACLIVCISVFSSNNSAYCAEKTPEKLVSDFYKWYIRLDAAGFDDTMYKYVYPYTVQRYRIGIKKGISWNNDSDYFLKSQDPMKEWVDTMIVHKAIKITDTVSLVPVSFPGFKNMHHIFVFVQKEKGKLYITKVEDTYPL